MNINELYKKFITECDGKISTDSRNIIPNSLFFALQGDNNDGNKYAEQALKLGCRYAVVDNKSYAQDDNFLLVEDSLEILTQLAHHHRKQFDIPVLAITGSNGKTTTKELIASVLKTEKNITVTEGNLNNHIGVPMTLLNISTKTDLAVIEMGANHIGEIAHLCEITEPTSGIITNIGRSHLGKFGGFDAVIRGKTELYRYLENHNGASFINGSDTLLLKESNTLEKITYLSEDSDCIVYSEKTLPFVSLVWNNNVIKSHLTGEYNIMNIAAAISIGYYFGIDDVNIKKGIESYVPKNNRSELVETKNYNSIIKDYYNANRSSMELAIENIANIKSEKKKVLILGDMFELGEYEMEEHNAIVEKIEKYDCFHNVFLLGEAFFAVTTNDNILKFKTTNNFIDYLNDNNIKESFILMKASNGMNFEELFNEIKH